MRVLVVGARGMMGHMACRVLGQDHDVYGTVRGPLNENAEVLHFVEPDRLLGQIDTGNLDAVAGAIRDLRPEVVLNCVGIVKQLDAASDAIASIECNSLLPHQLARICSTEGARLIHLSTDCVFSGRRGNYTLNDIPDPVDLYGRSKLLGELDEGEGLTIRTSIVGRQISGQTSFFEWILANRGASVRGFTRAIYSGVTTLVLARVIGEVIQHHPELSGVWQVASESITKYEIIVTLNTLLDLGLDVEPDEQFVIDRSLDGSAFVETTGIRTPAWQAMLSEFAEDQAAYSEFDYR